MWAIFAFGSAVFAALTSILAKIGINGVNSNLATAIRTVVVLIMAWGMVFIVGGQFGISEICKKVGYSIYYPGLQQALHGYATIKRCRLGKRPKSYLLIN